jgi:hypothetical protein
MAKFIEVPLEKRDEVLKSSKVVTSGVPVPDGTYAAYVTGVGTFETRKKNILMTFQGSLSDSNGETYEFRGDKFIVITDSLAWRNMENGKRYEVTIENRRLVGINESDEE